MNHATNPQHREEINTANQDVFTAPIRMPATRSRNEITCPPPERLCRDLRDPSISSSLDNDRPWNAPRRLPLDPAPPGPAARTARRSARSYFAEGVIARAAATLEKATTAAEILEASEEAGVAYTAAKAAARLTKIKDAHDTVLAACRKAMADALVIESRAQCRLADEYDAAVERGEVQKWGGDRKSDQDS
jgi:hypothetical protein